MKQQIQCAQGTIEYLIILAIVVIIALVVVGFLNNSVSNGTNIGGMTDQIRLKTGPISIKSMQVTTDGDYALEIEGIESGETEVTNIKISDENQNFNKNNKVSLGRDGVFVIDTNDYCTEGDVLIKDLTITITKPSGLTETRIIKNARINCSNYNIDTDRQATKETILLISPISPAANASYTNADENVDFVFKTNKTTTDCNLYIDNTLKDENTQTITANTIITLDANIATEGTKNYDWKISCTDINGNTTSSADRNIAYVEPPETNAPIVYLLSPSNEGASSTTTVNFDFNVTDDSSLSRCELFINGISDTNKTTGLNNGENTIQKTFTSDLIFDWNVSCYDEYSNKGNSNDTWQYTINSNAHEITNCLELQDINEDLSGDYILMNDINCYDDTHLGGALWNGGAGFDFIGEWSSNPFTGSLNGQGYVISDLYMNRPAQTGSAIFGYVENASFKRIGIEDANLIYTGGSQDDGAILFGYGYGVTLENSYITGSVSTSKNNNGSFGGYLRGDSTHPVQITNVYSTADIKNSHNGWGGGIVGLFHGNDYGDINNVIFTGTVQGGGYTGVIVGAIVAGHLYNAHEYDNPNDSITNCVTYLQDGATYDCNEHALSWFYDINNAPYDEWDFDTIWEENPDTYPTLRKG